MAELSKIFDETFRDGPRIHNELVNRRALSSAAAAARIRLVKLMFTDGKSEWLGMKPEKKPPEMSMYLSVLLNTGIHHQHGESWRIGEPHSRRDEKCNVLPTLRKIREIVKDEPDQVAQALTDFSAGAARLIIFNGGTGISRRDRTYDVISKQLEKTLPGFGELFRMLSFAEVGAAAMLSRATAGVYRERVVVSIPGSPNAVGLALEKLILPEIQHLAWELIR